MEKETLLSTLTEKLGETPLSQRTLDSYISDNLPADGTEPDEAYWEKHTKFLKSLTGQYRADVAKEIEDFKKKYKPSAEDADKHKGDGDNDLQKRIEQLEQSLKLSAKTASENTLRAQVGAMAKSLKVANEAMWEDAVKAVTIGENDSADDVTANAKKIYERNLRRYMGEGAAPYGSSGRSGASKEAEEAAKAKREAFKEKMRRAGKLPKKES